MKQALKRILNFASPNLSRILRNAKMRKALHAAPQLSGDGMKFSGVQTYENYEPVIFGVLEKLMERCNVFVNVGANCGIYCLKFARAADKVYAFEALPENLSFIYRNIRQNDLASKVSVFPVAVGQTSGLAKFFGASTGGSLLKGWNQQVDDGIDVPLFSLDALIGYGLQGTKPLILIDVEGAEFEVIKGAKHIVTSIPEAIFCVEIPAKEFMPGEKMNPHFYDIFEFFHAAGFLAFEIAGAMALMPIDLPRVREYQTNQRYSGIMAIFSKTPL